MQNCQNCAAPVREEMKFCPGCGKSLQNQTPDENTALGGGTEKIESTASVLDQEPHETEANKTSVSSETPQPQPPVGQITKKTWIVTAVFGVAALVGLLALEGVNTANENAESAKLSQRAEVAAQECANIIGQHVSAVESASVESHVASVEKVRVKFRSSNEEVIGKIAECNYSMNGNLLSIEEIEWTFERDDIETEVSYDRGTNVVDLKRVPSPTVKAESSGGSNASCESAFRAAAAVPLSRDNNAEIAQTTRSCSDVDEWWSTLKRYPAVFGVSRFLESERGLYVGSACLVGQGSPVCRDADLRGIGF